MKRSPPSGFLTGGLHQGKLQVVNVVYHHSYAPRSADLVQLIQLRLAGFLTWLFYFDAHEHAVEATQEVWDAHLLEIVATVDIVDHSTFALYPLFDAAYEASFWLSWHRHPLYHALRLRLKYASQS